jgi:2-polyprenyl-3-methyl-5-hydroxy-6-metoxy-1,4-benzoquinol methylase
MARTGKFWDWIANRYARQPVADEASYRKKLEITRTCLRDDMDVLEIGCGTGSTAIAHAPYVRHVHAIDGSVKMIEIARAKAASADVSNVDFIRQEIDDLAAPDGTYDAILALSILHLLEDWRAVIARLHAMLKPGGVLVTSTLCAGDEMPWIRFIAPVGRFLGLLPLISVFTHDQLKAALTDAGFAIEHDWKPGKGKAVFILGRKAG